MRFFHGVSDGSLNHGWRVRFPMNKAILFANPPLFASQKDDGFSSSYHTQKKM